MEVRDKGEVDVCFKLPLEIRKELSRPYGPLFVNVEAFFRFIKDKDFVTVGDVVTETSFSLGLRPRLALIDGKTKRVISKEVKSVEGYEVISVRNEPGLVRASTIEVLKKLLDSGKRSVVLVEGEEDLLVVPLVLYMNEGSYIVYGQPNAGIVVLEVNRFSKERVKVLFERFIPTRC
ncbi:MAG: GTP-dependent dephospho-CoA kinase family protein [Thermoprotei archaeon]